jgi:hypothetical protein
MASRMFFRLGKLLASLLGFVGLIVLLTTHASACNIPVFRYALERWKPDLCRLTVFHDSRLTNADDAIIASIRSESVDAGGGLNNSVEVVDVRDEIKEEHANLWKSVKNNAQSGKPYAALTCKVAMERSLTQWHGPLSQLNSETWFAPRVSKAVTSRLLTGDAIVWLLVPGKDENKNEATRKVLNTTLPALEKKIKLPDGIGLPGSELYSELPLLVKFSVFELDPRESDHQVWIKLFRGIRSDELDTPLVVPVFGKARALEVVPGDSLDVGLIEDLTMFLCGACSCQVKERNPGFDLLVSVKWNFELFGEDAEVPAAVSTLAREPSTPRKLAIPPGRNK